MSVTRAYKPLAEIPGAKVMSCSAVLPNHMQCWRSGDFQVTETASTTAEDGTSVTVYQLCRRHALIQKEADAQEATAVQKEAADQAQLAKDEAATAVIQTDALSGTDAAPAVD
jgi:hypothetical protein